LLDWAQIACGKDHSLAVKTDGTLWALGRNSEGQLGLGDTTEYSSPVKIGALTDWKYVYGGSFGYWSAAIKTDGTLWTWGTNNKGQLGLGDATGYSSPVQVGALTNWFAFSSGLAFALAITNS
jgi:alpha-tubulin suppressor-like RCC1 family protein